MKKQKICIIGDGLSGLITTLLLGKLDLQIDLISSKLKKKKDNRTTAISPSNHTFLSKNLFKKNSKLFFKCKKIKLYQEKENNSLFNFMNFENPNTGLMYIAENKKLKSILTSHLKKNKKINIIKSDISEIDVDETSITIKRKKSNYDMVILCVGKNYKIIDKLIGKRLIKEDMDEVAFTSIVNHNLKFSDSKQFFLKEGPMAILPINKKNFSLIWSMNNAYKSYTDDEIKNKITSKLKIIFPKKSIINLGSVNRFPIYFKFNKNFFNKNVLALGESIYSVHPVAGQGFNLVLRDIEELYKKIKKNIFLGLQLKNSQIFNDLFQKRKPENLLYGLGINFTQKFFKYNKLYDPIKTRLLKDIGRSNYIKKIGLKIADKGIINN